MATAESKTGAKINQVEQKLSMQITDLKKQILSNSKLWPVSNPIGYLEISGPKKGRDYSDKKLSNNLSRSLEAITEVFASD